MMKGRLLVIVATRENMHESGCINLDGPANVACSEMWELRYTNYIVGRCNERKMSDNDNTRQTII